jgi:hypothetical protein
VPTEARRKLISQYHAIKAPLPLVTARCAAALVFPSRDQGERFRHYIRLGLVMFVCGALAWAQTPVDGSVAVAQAELARVRSLVETGMLPRASLEKAQDALADAQDGVLLRRLSATVTDLDVEQADETVAASKRRVERRQKALDEATPLVNDGVAPPGSLLPLANDLEQEKRVAALVEEHAQAIHQIAEMARAEEAELGRVRTGESPPMYPNYAKVAEAYRLRFGKSMPVSAMGETAVHRSMGFDHRGRVDIALNPDQPEGVWLMEYLKQNHIPFIAFRGPVAGKATGAHIHIGPASTRLASGG